MTSSASRSNAITFLFSDTGGGHRAAAEAIREAIHAEYGDSVQTRMVDFLKEYAPSPFNLLPDLYPLMVKVPQRWGWFFDLTNGRYMGDLVSSVFWPYVGHAARRLIWEHRSEVLVSVHPLVNPFALKALGPLHLPYITIVTDLVTTHSLWFDRRADLTLVPTEIARQNALACGLPPDRIRLVGQPVSLRFGSQVQEKKTTRQALGWPAEKFTTLLVGGGDGMGPVAEIAHAIDDAELDINLVIVAGRNTSLGADLRQASWKKQPIIYDFVEEMPDFMRASDAILTKAGPGTIAEALITELPIILYAKLYGQENGNVDFVESQKVGVWAPAPALLVETLRRWVNNPAELHAIVENCQRAARPDAARTIAHLLVAQSGLSFRRDWSPSSFSVEALWRTLTRMRQSPKKTGSFQ